MSSEKHKILVVDDTPDNIQILLETLKDEYAVVAATNGEKALRLASAEPRPSLILLDIMMPGMDGYEVCQRLKADETLAKIPVIFVTALSDEQDEKHGLDLGAVDYVTKPFRPSLVKARVRNHLELKLHRDNLEALVRQRTRELTITQEVTIESMASLAEYRDPETGGHINRTKRYVRRLAQHLATKPQFAEYFDDETINLLFQSAPLHDLGKIGVRDHILLKPGKLEGEDWEEMKRHTIYGRDAIAATEKKLGRESFLRFAKEIAHTHHERWDGMGYPQGLVGEAIPILGRLMAIADVYDALISRRCYKPPFPHERAVKIILEGEGTHFDPAMVAAFRELAEDFRQIAIKYADSDEERDILQGGATSEAQPSE